MTDFRCKVRNYMMDVPVDKIQDSVTQVRKVYEKESIEELSRNIKEIGIIQPLCVRRADGEFRLVAGKRRLLAAKIAGMQFVPCIVTDSDDDEALLMSISENTQRKNINYFEQAEAILLFMRMTGMSQTETSAKLGQKQSTVANKLRLLALPSQVKNMLIKNKFKERHARALLRLDSEEMMVKAIKKAFREKMNVTKFEDYIDSIVKTKNGIVRPFMRGFCNDLRIYVNSINHTVDMMKNSGIDTLFEKNEDEKSIMYRIIINK